MYGHLSPAMGYMVVRKIVRKKKKNEAEDALNKIMGSKELEVAAVILKELAERKERNKKNHDKKTKKRQENKTEKEEIVTSILENNHLSLKEFRNLSLEKPIVYLVASYDKKHLKIGSATHPKDRIGQIQTCQPGDITIVSFIETNDYNSIEKQLHEEFKDYNTRGEWFTNNPKIINRFIEINQLIL